MKHQTPGVLSGSWSVFLAVVLSSCAAKTARNDVPSPPTPQYERDFLQNRVAHQQAAVEMAQACVQKAQREPLKQFCTALIDTESAESKQLQSWLSEWYGLSAPPGAQERATQGYRNFMQSVRTQSGPQFELAFLSALRLHHHEGVDESRTCQARAVHSELRSVCATMLDEQEREVKQMNAWICEWFRDCVER